MNKPLRELADVHYGKSPSEVLSEDGPFPIVGTGGIYGRAKSALFTGPAVVVARKGSLGKPQFMNDSFWPVDTTYAVVPKAGIDAKWLYYNLDHFDLTKLNEATGVPSISRDWLCRIKFDDPGSEQQLRIAEILSTLDETIEQTEALIAKMQQVKAGLMHDLFTRGVTPDGRLRPTREQAPEHYKESPLGWIPKEWEVALISEAFDIQLGKMLNKLAKTGKGSAPYLGNRAVQWDFVDCTEIEVMDFTASERLKFSLNPGDLLVCEGGDVGRTAIWRGEMEGCFYQKAIHRLRPKSGAALPAFMLRFMRFAKESGCFREFTSQSSIAHLTQEKLGAIPMLLPRPDEQSRIAKRFDAVDEQIQNEISKLAKLRDQKHGLMHDLLTGRVQASSTASDRSVRSD
jgi:type I restriction enzyme S subunit